MTTSVEDSKGSGGGIIQENGFRLFDYCTCTHEAVQLQQNKTHSPLAGLLPATTVINTPITIRHIMT